jgi:hypothetical protein
MKRIAEGGRQICRLRFMQYFAALPDGGFVELFYFRGLTATDVDC